MAHQPIATAQSRVNLGANSDQSPGHRILELVLFGKQRNDPGIDGPAEHTPIGTFGDNPRPNFDFLSDSKYALK